MISTEELRLVRLEIIDDGCLALSLPHSPDDWAHRRAAALELIRRTGLIPDVLLNLVLVELKERTPVRLKLRRIPEGFSNIEVEVVGKEINPSGKLEFSSPGAWRPDAGQNALGSGKLDARFGSPCTHCF
jgi:hypothetical protein